MSEETSLLNSPLQDTDVPKPTTPSESKKSIFLENDGWRKGKEEENGGDVYGTDLSFDSEHAI